MSMSMLDVLCRDLQEPLTPSRARPGSSAQATAVKGFIKTLQHVADLAPELLLPPLQDNVAQADLASTVVARADRLIAAAQQLLHSSNHATAHRLQCAALNVICTVCCVAADLLDCMIDSGDDVDTEGIANDTAVALLVAVAQQLFNAVGAVLQAGAAQYDITVTCMAADCLRAALACPAFVRVAARAIPRWVPASVESLKAEDIAAAVAAYTGDRSTETLRTDGNRDRNRTTLALCCAAIEGDVCRIASGLPKLRPKDYTRTPSHSFATPSTPARRGAPTSPLKTPDRSALGVNNPNDGLLASPVPGDGDYSLATLEQALTLAPLIADGLGAVHGSWALQRCADVVHFALNHTCLPSVMTNISLSPLLARYAVAGSGLGIWLAPSLGLGSQTLLRVESATIARIARFAPPTSVSYAAQAHAERVKDHVVSISTRTPSLITPGSHQQQLDGTSDDATTRRGSDSTYRPAPSSLVSPSRPHTTGPPSSWATPVKHANSWRDAAVGSAAQPSSSLPSFLLAAPPPPPPAALANTTAALDEMELPPFCLPPSAPTWGCLPLIARVVHSLSKCSSTAMTTEGARWAAIHALSFIVAGDLADTQHSLVQRMRTSSWLFELPTVRSALTMLDPASVMLDRLVHSPGAVDCLCKFVASHTSLRTIPPSMHRLAMHAIPMLLLVPAADDRCEAVARYIAGASSLFPPKAVLEMVRTLAQREAAAHASGVVSSSLSSTPVLYRTFAFARQMLLAWSRGSSSRFLLEALSVAIPSMCFVTGLVDPLHGGLIGLRPSSMSHVEELRCLCDVVGRLPSNAFEGCLRAIRCVTQYMACCHASLQSSDAAGREAARSEALRVLSRFNTHFSTSAARTYLKIVLRGVHGHSLEAAAAAASHSEFGVAAQVDGAQLVQARFQQQPDAPLSDAAPSSHTAAQGPIPRSISASLLAIKTRPSALMRRMADEPLVSVAVADACLAVPFPRACRPVQTLELGSSAADGTLIMRAGPPAPHTLAATLNTTLVGATPMMVQLLAPVGSALAPPLSQHAPMTPTPVSGLSSRVVCETHLVPTDAACAKIHAHCCLPAGLYKHDKKEQGSGALFPFGKWASLEVTASPWIPFDSSGRQVILAQPPPCYLPFAMALRPLAPDVATAAVWAAIEASGANVAVAGNASIVSAPDTNFQAAAAPRIVSCTMTIDRRYLEPLGQHFAPFQVPLACLPPVLLHATAGAPLTDVGYQLYFDGGDDLGGFVFREVESFIPTVPLAEGFDDSCLHEARLLLTGGVEVNDATRCAVRLAATSAELLGLLEHLMVEWCSWLARQHEDPDG